MKENNNIIIEYATNYITPEVMELASPFDKINKKEIYIKYPGGRWDIETLKDLCNRGYKVILHGIIPSTGSIIDPHLCDHFEEFAKIVKDTNQKWLSLHFSAKPKYETEKTIEQVVRKNLETIRKELGDIPILIENLPQINTTKDWCADTKVIAQFCEKFGLGFLLDIPHAVIASKIQNRPVEQYIDELPLDRVKEIHVSGWSVLEDGTIYDSHVMCNEESYRLLEYCVKKCKNLEFVSSEYGPGRDYAGHTIAADYLKNRTPEMLYKEQQIQMEKIIEICERAKIVKSEEVEIDER